MMTLDRNKVVLGMSGGVDSSVAASLLKEQGFEVYGVSMQLYSCDRPLAKGCCTPADRMDARGVCEKLDIPFEILDLRPQFKNVVMQYFADEYSRGRTPLPCAPCNKEIRFKTLVEYADQIGAYWIATGHYARVRENEDGSFSLLRGKNLKKDQSYFLWALGQEELARLKLPVGDFDKEEVRALARRYQLPTSEKKDSQEVCFVGDQDYPEFLEEHFPEATHPSGHFVNLQGEVVGEHRGVHSYTVGQRRGLGVSLGERQYVVSLNPEKNEIVLGKKEALIAKGLIASRFHAVEKKFDSQNPLLVKIRSTHPGVTSKITFEDEKIYVHFEQPQEAVTPGQAAVFYSDDQVLGGAWIETSFS